MAKLATESALVYESFWHVLVDHCVVYVINWISKGSLDEFLVKMRGFYKVANLMVGSYFAWEITKKSHTVLIESPRVVHHVIGCIWGKFNPLLMVVLKAFKSLSPHWLAVCWNCFLFSGQVLWLLVLLWTHRSQIYLRLIVNLGLSSLSRWLLHFRTSWGPSLHIFSSFFCWHEMIKL